MCTAIVFVQMDHARFEQQDGRRAAEFKITFFRPALARAALALVLHNAPDAGRADVYMRHRAEITRV